MKLRTKILIGLAAVFAVSLLVFAAGPPPGTFLVPSFFTTNAAKIYGTNGITVSSNPPTGIYLIDGFNLTNGFSGGGGSNYLFNQNQFSSTAGGTNISIRDGVLLTNMIQYGLTQVRANTTNSGWYTHGGYWTNWEAWYWIDRADGLVSVYIDPSGVVSWGKQISYLNGDGSINIAGQANIFADGSAAFAAGGALQIGPDGNLDVIKAVPYTWPAANAVGAFTNNGVGGLGWFNGFLTSASTNNFHQKFSVWSNGVEIVALGVTTNFDFYGFTLLTNANGKVSLGAPTSTATSGINVQSNAFGGTVGSGTNLLFLTSSNLLLTATNTATAGGTNSVSHDTAQPITTKSSPTFQNIGITTDASVSNHLAIGVNNTATNRLAAFKTRFFALTNATGGWGDWMAASPMPTRRDWFWVQDNGVGIGVMGVQSAASIGTAGHVEATTNEWPAFSYTTGAALLSSNGISSALAATTLGMFPGKNLYFSYVGRVTLMSTQRVWIGYSSATTATMGANSDTPTTSHVAAIRLSSAAAGALTNWAFVTCDGSACTVNAGGPVSLTTTNVHVFEIMEDRPNVRWLAYVDGICIGTNTANLPISGMKYIAMVSTLEAVAKAIKGNAVYGEMDNRNDGAIVLNP